MITVNRVGSSILGTVNGKPFKIPYVEDSYLKLKDLQTKFNANESNESLAQEATSIIYNHEGDIYVRIANNLVYSTKKKGLFLCTSDQSQVLEKFPITGKLSKIINELVEQEADVSPYVKALIRFTQTPVITPEKFTVFCDYLASTYTDEDKIEELMEKYGYSYEKAKEYATYPQIGVTDSGYLLGYKIVRELTYKYSLDDDQKVTKVPRYTCTVDENTGLVTYDKPNDIEKLVFEPVVEGDSWDAFLCYNNITGECITAHIIKVNCIHELDGWDKVNCNDRDVCVKGLHVGGLDYIKGYQAADSITMNILINPAMIGAISNAEMGAIRVKQYIVYSVFEHVNKSNFILNSYDQLGDNSFDELITKAMSIQ